MYCSKCGAPARKIHRPLLLKLLFLRFAALYYCWPCHRRFVKIARVARRGAGAFFGVPLRGF